MAQFERAKGVPLSMRVRAAREAATDWVLRNAAGWPWVHGAYFTGSVLGLDDDAELPATSDIDVLLVTGPDAPLKPGKFRHHGALLEASYVPEHKLASAESVLASYHLAGAFRTDSVIYDPTGHLGQLHTKVAGSFADRRWVLRRCLDAQSQVKLRLGTVGDERPWHERVTMWLFGTGITTHVVLTAAMRNPTIRLRYLAVRAVLEELGYLDLHEQLLGLMGCAEMSPHRVEQHLNDLGRTFDVAAGLARTRFFFSADITPQARPIALDGGSELVRRGFHREAMFWTVATFARCHAILAADAPAAVQAEHAPAFAACLADLGINSEADLRDRARTVLDFLPELGRRAEDIVARHPLATGDLGSGPRLY
jgi:hypothetical protein